MPYDFPNSPSVGDIVTGSTGASYRWDGTKWVVVGPPASTVQSFNARTGAVLLTQGDVALALSYTPYNAANPSHYVPDAPNDANAYVRSANAWANGDTRYLQQSFADTRYLRLATGGTLGGPLTLAADPTTALQASTKQYTDAHPYVAATSGAVALTGSLSETSLGQLRIPAGTMGPNGVIQLSALFSCTSNANIKSMLVRFTGTSGSVSGGVIGQTMTATTTQSNQFIWLIRNNNVQNSQIIHPSGSGLTTGVVANPNVASVDTTVDAYCNINGFIAVGTDTLTLLHAYLVVFRA
jgi:hypothetical protein